ncbi:MAG: dihydroorotate dehydrogenase electron transfer subunit [Lentimicrobium sp.]|nr:dihydroorotate dehydrogenase electron transfer subunit [Lentimicrobium sp.]
MKKYILDFSIISNQVLNHNHNLLELGCAEKLPPIIPGQFAEARVDGSHTTYLRRPFSIHRVDYSRNTIHLLIKSVGDGTRSLAGLVTGSTINIMLPLGNGFPVEENSKVLLVGGGCGVAPLWFLADELKRRGSMVTMLIGGRSAVDVLMADDYRKFGDLLISTEDGSLGETGMVTNHSVFRQEKLPYNAIYCCGPDGMMKAVSHIAEKQGIQCYVSLENTMACGIGACLCCVVDTKQGHRCVCTDGPVFNSNELKGWSAETEVGCSIEN